MRRRATLRYAGTLGAMALAGCLGSGDEQATDGGGTDTATGTPALTSRSFEVTDVSSGQGDQSATVAFGDPVTVTGTTAGNNGCYTAVLESAEYDGSELVVTVRAKERQGTGGCTEAIVDIDYEATFGFAGDGPDRVVVDHDSMGEVRTVADVERSG